MGDDFTPQSQLVWPDWILTVGPETPSALQSIGDACERFRNIVKDGYVSDQVWQRQLTEVSDDHINSGVLDQQGNWLKRVSLPRDFAIAQLYNNGSPCRILDVVRFAKRAALVQLIDMTSVSLAAGSLFVALSCLRSVIEHIGHTLHIIEVLRTYSVPTNFNEANRTLWEVNSKLLQMAYGTRVDWQAMISGESKDLLERGKIKYRPNELRVDVTAEQVLNAVDRLDKQIKGTRAVYEVLCEFAHPNIGAILGLTRTVGPREDDHGCVWVRKELSLMPPLGAVKDMGPVLDRIFAITSECVRHFEKLQAESEQQKEKLLKLSQTVLKPVLAKNHDLLNPYALCPCSSGSKVRFCCGAS